MAMATGRTLDYVTLAMIASQTMQSWSPFSDFWEDQLPWQPLYVVYDVEYCDLLTMATRAIEWGSIILSQDALTKNGVISCIAGMPHLKQLYNKTSVMASFKSELITLCTWEYVPGCPYFSYCKWWKTGSELGGNEASMYTYLHLLHYLWDTHDKCTYVIKESMYGHILRASCVVQSITHQCIYQSQTHLVGAIHLAEPDVTQL